MALLPITLTLIYAFIIVVLTWARLKYFSVDTKTAQKTSHFYDPIVVLHICTTFYNFIVVDRIEFSLMLLTSLFYISGIAIFLFTVLEAPSRSYAASSNVDQLITTGPYSLVRHPLYLSYALIWIGSSILFNSLVLWITLAYLLVFYFISATKEEKTIANTEYSREYEHYRQNVGMFLPRIRGWKS